MYWCLWAGPILPGSFFLFHSFPFGAFEDTHDLSLSEDTALLVDSHIIIVMTMETSKCYLQQRCPCKLQEEVAQSCL